MEVNKVPQDDSSIYRGLKRALYATDKEGDYNVVASSGWEAEEEATQQAVAELVRLADKAYAACRRGELSPLPFHMYDNRLDMLSLSQATGLFQWRIKRHFKPAVFAKLPEKMLTRYSEVMGISNDELKKLPEREA